jgi:hypothetical protein
MRNKTLEADPSRRKIALWSLSSSTYCGQVEQMHVLTSLFTGGQIVASPQIRTSHSSGIPQSSVPWWLIETISYRAARGLQVVVQPMTLMWMPRV